MAAQPRPTRWPLIAAGAALPLLILGALLLQGPTEEPSPSARQRSAVEAPSSRSAAARPVSGGTAQRVAPPASEDIAEDDPEAASSRREQYTAAFNRKLDRRKQRLAEDCAGDDFLAHALDDFDEVRDRIVDSAVATDQGLKTHEEQREYEHRQLLEFDTRLCREVERRSPDDQCRRHFRSCDHILEGRQVTGAL